MNDCLFYNQPGDSLVLIAYSVVYGEYNFKLNGNKMFTDYTGLAA